jgi:hypothetical protein
LAYEEGNAIDRGVVRAILLRQPVVYLRWSINQVSAAGDKHGTDNNKTEAEIPRHDNFSTLLPKVEDRVPRNRMPPS